MGFMEAEIDAASQWWCDHLHGYEGESFCLLPPTDEQKAAFRAAFKRLILADQAFLEGCEAAHCRGDPSWGSYIRCVATHDGPDSYLYDSAVAAGIGTTRMEWPPDCYMWINPGRVSVRFGYYADSPRVVIYPAEASK